MLYAAQVALLLMGVICLGGALWSLLMLYRNKLVYRFRTECLERDLDVYHALPSYDDMMRRVKIWNMRGFLPRELR